MLEGVWSEFDYMSKLTKGQWESCRKLWNYFKSNDSGFSGCVKKNKYYALKLHGDTFISNTGYRVSRDVVLSELDMPSGINLVGILLSVFIEYDYDMCKGIINSRITNRDGLCILEVPTYCRAASVNNNLLNTLMKPRKPSTKKVGRDIHTTGGGYAWLGTDFNDDEDRCSIEAYAKYVYGLTPYMAKNGYDFLLIHMEAPSPQRDKTLTVSGFKSGNKEAYYRDSNRAENLEIYSCIEGLLNALEVSTPRSGKFIFDEIYVLSKEPTFISKRVNYKRRDTNNRVVFY